MLLSDLGEGHVDNDGLPGVEAARLVDQAQVRWVAVERELPAGDVVAVCAVGHDVRTERIAAVPCRLQAEDKHGGRRQ